MEYFIIYRPITQEELSRGGGPDGISRIQSLSPDKGVVVVPAAYANGTALLDIPVDVLRDSLWSFTKSIRSQLVVNGAYTSWGVVDSEPLDLQNLQIKAEVSRFRKQQGDNDPLQFTLKNNSVITLSPDDAIVMVAQALEYVDGIYGHARGLRAALDSAQSAQEALAVDVFRGWPTVS